MSLNRSEQQVYDYLMKQPDERRYWQEKLRRVAKSIGDEHSTVADLERELWRYTVERSAVVSSLREANAAEGLRRTSMKNLAELLLRLWTDPRPKPKPGTDEV
ncbi:MAG: hypothetical protein FJ399_09840 [Verrucomicrobia bacterium]|nr:hypothetical protein [Verrucomicrobiota bacterium]